MCTELGAHFPAMTHLPVATIQYSNGTVVNIFGPSLSATGILRGRTTTRARGRAKGPAAIQGTVAQGTTTVKRRRRRQRRANVNQQLPG
jgi:hypothetical protein